MSEPKTLKALETVIRALQPLDPESRRRVIEAAHALVEISPGAAGGDAARAKSRRK